MRSHRAGLLIAVALIAAALGTMSCTATTTDADPRGVDDAAGYADPYPDVSAGVETPAPPTDIAVAGARLVPYLRDEVAYVVPVGGTTPGTGAGDGDVADVFHCEGAFWTLHEGFWFRTERADAPWSPVEMKRVPRALFRVCGFRPAGLSVRREG